ncbi:MAG: hypothetical protein AAF447_13250, partial [Myxococcota bacterium]
VVDEEAAVDPGASSVPVPAATSKEDVEQASPAPEGGDEALDALFHDLSVPQADGDTAAKGPDSERADTDFTALPVDVFGEVDEDQDSMTGVLRPEELAAVRSATASSVAPAPGESIAGGSLSPAMRKSMAEMGVDPGDFEEMTSISSVPPELEAPLSAGPPSDAPAATAAAEETREDPDEGDDPDEKKKGFFKKLFG